MQRPDEAAFGLAGGCVAMVGAGFAAAGIDGFGARLAVMALAALVAAAVLADWRACAGVTAAAALIFVGSWPATTWCSPAIVGRGRSRSSSREPRFWGASWQWRESRVTRPGRQRLAVSTTGPFAARTGSACSCHRDEIALADVGRERQ